MPQVQAETVCVRSPWLPIEPPGTGAQGVELEVRGDHEGLMRHGTGSLEGLDVSGGLRVSQSTFGSPWAGLGVVPGEWGGLLGPQEMGVPGDPD